jgi:hypothetical protein
MATSHAPLYAEAPEEGFEGQGYDVSPEVLDRIEPVSHPRLRDGAKRVLEAKGKGKRSDAERVTHLQERITLIPEAPRDETQVKIDEAVVARYDRLYNEQLEVSALMQARMIRADVAYDRYDEALQDPGIVTRKEVLSKGELPFGILARRHQALETLLLKERQKYVSACRRLGLITEELPTQRKSKGASNEHVLENFSQVHDALERLVERVLVKREPLTLDIASDVHAAAVKALKHLKLPAEGAPVSEAVRSRLLSIKFLYQQLETPIDELRMSLLREIEEIALDARMAEERGEKDGVTALRQQLGQLLKHTERLFSTQDKKDTAETAAARERYHLLHAWYKKLKTWMEDGTIDRAPETTAYVDGLRPQVQNARHTSYPDGFALSMLPLEVYVGSSKH